MITFAAIIVLTVLAIAAAAVNVVRSDGRSFHRPPTSHFTDLDFVAPRDRLGF
jgi:hypothetical protein